MNRFNLVAVVAAILVPSLVHASPMPMRQMVREMTSMKTFTVDEAEARRLSEGGGYVVFGDANFTDKLTDLLSAQNPKHVKERLNDVLEDMAKEVDILAAREVGQTFDSEKAAKTAFESELRALQFRTLEQYSLVGSTAAK